MMRTHTSITHPYLKVTHMSVLCCSVNHSIQPSVNCLPGLPALPPFLPLPSRCPLELFGSDTECANTHAFFSTAVSICESVTVQHGNSVKPLLGGCIPVGKWVTSTNILYGSSHLACGTAIYLTHPGSHPKEVDRVGRCWPIHFIISFQF